MKNNIFTKTVAAAAACAFFTCAGFFAVRAVQRIDVINGRVSTGTGGSVYVQTFSDDLSLSVEGGTSKNFFEGYSYNTKVAKEQLVVPGQTIEGDVVITLKSGSVTSASVYVYAQPTGVMSGDDAQRYADFYAKNSSFIKLPTNMVDTTAATLKQISEEIGGLVDLTIKHGNNTVYNGKLNGSAEINADYVDLSAVSPSGPGSGSGSPPLSGIAMTAENAIYLGKFGAGHSETLHFKLTLPSTMGNKYKGKVAMIDWVFVAVANPTPDPTPVTSPSPTPVTPTPPTPTPTPEPEPTPIPKTGEEAIPYAAASVACALGGLGMLWVAFSRKKERAEAD